MIIRLLDLVDCLNGEVVIKAIGSADILFKGSCDEIPFNLMSCKVALVYAEYYKLNILLFNYREEVANENV